MKMAPVGEGESLEHGQGVQRFPHPEMEIAVAVLGKKRVVTLPHLTTHRD
jgi:hypothetical protein